MLCRPLLFLSIAISLAACSSEFCTRHSDCPPEAACGTTGLCESVAPQAYDANSGDGSSTITDAMPSGPDAKANNSDAMPGGPDAMATSDASPFSDGGHVVLDSGLRPPDDAMVGDAAVEIDAAPGFSRPTLPEGGTLSGTSGDVGTTDQLDAGLAP